jgi:hypothetical protein
MRVIRVSLLAALAVLVFAATLRTRRSRWGRCGMHLGKLIRRNQLGSQSTIRTGPKRRAAPRRAAARSASTSPAQPHRRARSPGRRVNLGGWNEDNVVLIDSAGSIVIGCNSVAKGLSPRSKLRPLKVFDEAVFGAGVFVTATIHSGQRLTWERTDISGAEAN